MTRRGLLNPAAVEWAHAQKVGDAAAKLTLIVLAREVDKDWTCYVGQAFLAEETEQSLSSVGRALKRLQTGRFITRTPRYDENGHRTSDLYKLCPAELPVNLPTSQIDQQADCLLGDMTGPSDQGERPTGQIAYWSDCERTSSPTEKTKDNNKHQGGVGGSGRKPKADDEHPRFAEWYEAYPVHKARGAAVRAFNKAVQKADPRTLIAAARLYRDDPRVRRGYGKHPATWLNAECWLDDPTSEPGLASTGTDGVPGHGPHADVNTIDWSKGFDL
ncbi:helix-turn-helix domain-containing protein [Actinoallomurus spadix]|uniref:Helix-turn-helix domain-containing protein n=1 Tax=Actinoallomurus spadix TaxID=79912 RepID=A0ABN0WVP5_9ACTN|nr:helix-turn-helix domain-containing protein [Actinoallomurus spadix]MCO5986551.1 helix-turn-helix domain-containing protein [Actinoallomurus spadix]